MLPAHRRQPTGFTLIELMIVVVIVGVLAAIAIPSFTAYIHRSRMAEATTFLGEIKQRQEAYRAEFGQYADVSADLDTYTPAALPAGGEVVTFPLDADIPNWVQLGAIPDGATHFQFSCIAGLPGEAAPAAYNLPNTDFWFVARAQGDLDGDGDTVQVEVLSHRATAWVSEAGGWE